MVDFFNPEVLRSRKDIHLLLPSVMGIQERPFTGSGQSRGMVLRREMLQAEGTILHSTIGGHRMRAGTLLRARHRPTLVELIT